MDRQQIEQLHQRASERYLSGDFREALLAWERLLEIDPSDTKAQEGARLCRMMAGGEESPAAAAPPAASPSPQTGLGVAPGPNGGRHAGAAAETPDLGIELDLGAIDGSQPPDAPTGAPQPPPAAAEPPLIPDLDDETLDRKLSFLDATPSAPAAAAVPAPPPESPVGTPDASRQGEGLDLGADGPTVMVAPVPGAPAQDTPASVHGPGETPAPGPDRTGGPALDEAGAELQGRIGALMAEARSFAGAGRSEEALVLLGRVLILDEENEEASKLQVELRGGGPATLAEEVEAWMNEAAQEFGNGNLAEARDTLNRVLDKWPGHNEAKFLMERVEAALASPVETPLTEAADLLPLPPIEDQLPVDETVPLAPLGPPKPQAVEEEAGIYEGPTVAEVAPQRPRRSSSLPKILLATLVLVAVGTAAWWYVPQYLPQLLGTEESSEPGDVNTAGTERPPRALPEVPPAVTGGSPESVSEPVAPSVEETMRRSIERARELYRQGDYARAVVAYDEVIEIDPQNVEARDGLLEAGERYKAQKEVEEQLERIRESFDDGAYANALRLLYRLPESVDQAMVQGYLVDGWHNLGVQELQSGDPKEAIEHFDEALAIDPVDVKVKKLRSLAAGFLERPKDATYYQVMEALPLREID